MGSSGAEITCSQVLVLKFRYKASSGTVTSQLDACSCLLLHRIVHFLHEPTFIIHFEQQLDQSHCLYLFITVNYYY